MLAVAGVVLAIVAALAAVAGAEHWRIVTGSVLVVTLLAGGTAVVVNSLFHHTSPRPGPVDVTEANAVSHDQIEAARWIRDNSSVDDVVITNRHCLAPVPPVRCDSRRFVVAAFSERQVLVEGWGYTPKQAELGLNRAGPDRVNYWRPDVLALNDGFIAAPTADAARQLAEAGVRWVFVDHTLPHAETLEPFAELKFQNRGVDVYELRNEE